MEVVPYFFIFKRGGGYNEITHSNNIIEKYWCTFNQVDEIYINHFHEQFKMYNKSKNIIFSTPHQ